MLPARPLHRRYSVHLRPARPLHRRCSVRLRPNPPRPGVAAARPPVVEVVAATAEAVVEGVAMAATGKARKAASP